MIFLKRAGETDIPDVQDLANKIWPGTYAGYLTEGQIGYMLEKMYNTAELLRQLKEGHIFLIAKDEEQNIGFAGFSLTDHENHAYKLHKLYVLPQMHGKGVGKLLMTEVFSLVKDAGGKSLELNVNRNNKAAEFYKRAGFDIKETVDIDIGNGFFMNDYVMKKTI